MPYSLQRYTFYSTYLLAFYVSHASVWSHRLKLCGYFQPHPNWANAKISRLAEIQDPIQQLQPFSLIYSLNDDDWNLSKSIKFIEIINKMAINRSWMGLFFQLSVCVCLCVGVWKSVDCSFFLLKGLLQLWRDLSVRRLPHLSNDWIVHLNTESDFSLYSHDFAVLFGWNEKCHATACNQWKHSHMKFWILRLRRCFQYAISYKKKHVCNHHSLHYDSEN